MDVDELRHALGGIVLEAAMIDGRRTAATLETPSFSVRQLLELTFVKY